MRLLRAAARPWPRRALARRGAVLAAAAILAVLAIAAIAAAAPRPGPAASRARPAVTPVAVTAARAVPATVAASPSPAPAPATLTAASGSCGLLDVTCQITSSITGWFAGLVTSAINPLVNFIGQSALSTPQPSSIPAVQSLWATSLAIADACYGLLVVIGGIIVMSHETLQASYSAKEIAPRIVVGFIAANLSMVLMTRAIGISNALSAALAGGGDASPAQAAVRQLMVTLAVSATAGNGIFLLLLELAGVIFALVLAAVYVIRMMAVVLLAAAAPVLLALWALPQTAWAARWYCRAGVAVLAIPAAQGLVLTAAVRVFFAPGWLGSGGYLEQVLITLCLLYILMRIPFWIARPVLSPFGPSPARRAVRFAFTAAVLSRIRPALAGGAGRGGAGREGGRPAAGGPGGPRGGGPGAGRARPGGTGAGAGGGTGRARWAQPPLPGMPSPPRRTRYQQLTLFDPPSSGRQRPAPPARPAPPPQAAPRGGGSAYRQLPLPGMPARPSRPRQLPLPLDPPPRRVPRTRTPPEGSR
jgi:hypothetical protein